MSLAVLLALAGCVDDTDDERDDGAMDDGDMDDGAMDGGDDAPAFDPAPRGDGLSAEEIIALAAAYSDEPLTGGQQPWPGHLIKWVNDDAFVLLHFDTDDPAAAAQAGETPQLLWSGLGVRGVFCSEDQPSPDFTHFHQYSAPTYAAGHGGEPNEEGYWLLHVNVRQFDSPFGDTGAPGVHEEFGVTEAPDCGDDYTPASHDPINSDGLDQAERNALALALDDDPLRGGQSPWPGHLIKWVSEEVFVLLHFDAEDPTADEATMLWTGIGQRSTFCDSTQPDEDFTHFHRSYSATYAAGHGGDAHQPGYWLLHMATHDFESPFGPTGGPGVHQEFGVTPPPSC